jgi:hypothetical protein
MTDELATVYVSKDRPLTKTFYATLGRIAVEFAHLEDDARQLLAHLMKSDYGLVVAAGETMGNLVTMCQRVAAFDTSLDDEAVEQLAKLIALINLVTDARNSALHAQWYPTSLPGHFCGNRSRRPSGRAPENLATSLYWTVDYANSIAEDIHQTRIFVTVFTSSLSGGGRLIPPWSRVTAKKFETLFERISVSSVAAGQITD